MRRPTTSSDARAAVASGRDDGSGQKGEAPSLYGIHAALR